MVSVIIPLYNKEYVVEKTLESVRKQTFTDYEVIIVNDGSTDRSLDVLSHYKQKNQDFFRQANIRMFTQPNAGVSAARNRGIQEANGEYIAFLDADDEWEPRYLECIGNLTERYPGCDIFATLYAYKEPNAFYVANVKGFPFDSVDGVIDNYFEIAINGRPPLWTSAVVVSKRAINAVGGFPLLASGEDLLTWARLACRFKIAYSKKVLSIFTRLPENYKNVPNRIPPAPKNDEGGRILSQLVSQYPHIKKLKAYRSLWHKIRFVIFVNLGKKRWAFQEYFKTLPWGFSNLDCYYRLFLNCLPIKWHRVIKKWVGKY